MLPFIEVFGITIPMYGLCIATGMLLSGYFVIVRCQKAGLMWENALIIGMSGIGVGFLGAKLLFLFLTYSADELWYLISSWNIEYILNSGFVFYGGLIGGLLGAFLGAKLLKVRLCDYENVLVPAIPLAHAFGRIGCLFAGCCYGKPVSWGPSVVYQNPFSDAPTGVPLAPIQAYEAGYNIVLFVVLSAIFRKRKDTKLILPLYIALYGVGRFVLEYFRFDSVRGIFLGLSTSQYISMAMIVLAVIMAYIRKQRTDEKF